MIQELIVDLNDYTIKKKLGEGQYGYVYLIQEKKTGKKLAAKVSKVECVKASDQKEFFKELVAFSKVKNGATLSLEGFNMTNFQEEHFPTILIPYMPNGSLDKLIEKDHEFPLPKKYIILLGIAEGMKYLHSQGIIHRDLKPANILLDDNFYPYIGDFGESKISELTKSAILMNTYKGSPAFMAPEIFSGDDYTYKADVFSYSILMYILLTNKNPYPGYRTEFKLQKDVLEGTRPNLNSISDEAIKSFLRKCWSSNSEERPDFEHIVEELKEERYRSLMNADYDEVNRYLQRFEDKLPELEKLPKGVSEIKVKADSGDARSMFQYAHMLKNGNGIPVNKEEAARYYKMSADKGNYYAMNNYAFMLQHGDGVSANKQEAARYYKMSADKGNSNAMNNYGLALQHGNGVSVDKQEAARYFKMAVKKGNIAAMCSYGCMLLRGDGIPANEQEAANYFKMAADKGNTKAMINYGSMLQHGIGVPTNKQEAARYYEMAAEKGNLHSMNQYAMMLENGDGIPANKQEAIRYYKMAADKGFSIAQENLTRLLKDK